MHVLLVVGAAEALLFVLLRPISAGGAVDRSHGLVDQVDGDLLVRVLAEGLARVAHNLRLGQVDGGPLIRCAVADQRIKRSRTSSRRRRKRRC